MGEKYVLNPSDRNSTLDCADTFLESIIQLEQFNWDVSNMTEGCTTSCENDINQWVSDVQSECAGAEMRELGNFIRPWSLPLIYQHKYQLGCMRGSADEWCLLESLTWEGSEIRQYDEDLCVTGKRDSFLFLLPEPIPRRSVRFKQFANHTHRGPRL